MRLGRGSVTLGEVGENVWVRVVRSQLLTLFLLEGMKDLEFTWILPGHVLAASCRRGCSQG